MYTICCPKPEIFRAYDIRGVHGTDLHRNAVYSIARAFAAQARSEGETQVVIGRDGRLSADILNTALQQGLMDGGLNITDVGAVPTPVLYFAAHHFKIGTAIMLTGSHNPAQYNGLKMMIKFTTLSGDLIKQLYRRCEQRRYTEGTGTLKTARILDVYINAITSRVFLKRHLTVAIDCGNGIAGIVAQRLYESLGASVIPLHTLVDGSFPNHHPDPSKPDNLKDLIAAVKTGKADVGLAFDGDGDRLGVVSQSGEIIWPDRQMMLYAQDVLSKRPAEDIIFDVKCTQLLSKQIKALGGNPVMCRTGHSYVKAALKAHRAPLAGEMSGHIFFNDNWFGFDDALYSGARLLALLSRQTESLGLFSALPNTVNTPELNIPVTDAEKFAMVDRFAAIANFPQGVGTFIDGVRVDFPDGFGLLRASNTTPMLVLRFEGQNEQSLTRIQNMFYTAMDSIGITRP